MARKDAEKLVLAIYPIAKGFGYALFEGPDRPIEWGVKKARGDKNKNCLAKATELINWFKPDLMILEDASAAGSRRSQRIRELNNVLLDHARGLRLSVRRYSRKYIRTTFETRGGTTRYKIALAIADRFPDLAAVLPPPRKIWMSEDPKLAIFDAVSLIVAFFHAETMKDIAESAQSSH